MFNFRFAKSISAALVLSGCCVMTIVGCDQSAPSADSAGLKYMLDAEPKETQTPTEVKETVAEGVAGVTLIGRVSAGEMDPFFPGRASFMVSEMPDESHGAGDPDHADNCPFCKRKLENAPRVIVEFKDDAGKVLETDSRSLFGIDKNSVVVIKGEANFNDTLNTLEFDAKSIYVRSGS